MPIGKRVWRVAASADGVGQQHAVQPGVNHTVAGAQGDATARPDEVGQRVVDLHVDRLRVGRGVAEALHHQVGTEKPRQARSFSSSRVIGPVVSCDPTEVMRGSQ